MNKTKIMIAGLLVTVFALGVGVVAFAQAQYPPGNTNSSDNGWGMMRRGMMGFSGNYDQGSRGYGPMHETMEEIIAEKLNLTEAEIEAKLGEGETLWSIAQTAGMTDDEIFSLMSDARSQALEKAVESGALTQEQADWMLQHMDQMHGNDGYARGGCYGAYGSNGAPSGMWQHMLGGGWNSPSE